MLTCTFELFLAKYFLYTLLNQRNACEQSEFLPSVFNVFVDATSDDHGNNSVIPGGDKHQSKTQTHSQEGQSPVGENTLTFN